MTKIQTPLPSPFQSSSSEEHEDTTKHSLARSFIKSPRPHQTQLQDAARQNPGTKHLVEPQGFVTSFSPTADAVRIGINTPLYATGAIAVGNPTVQRLGTKVPASILAISKGSASVFSAAGVPARIAELPFRTLTTGKDIKGQGLRDSAFSGTKLAATAIELAADSARWVTDLVNRPSPSPLPTPPSIKPIPSQLSHQIPRAVLRRPPSHPAPKTVIRPSQGTHEIPRAVLRRPSSGSGPVSTLRPTAAQSLAGNSKTRLATAASTVGTTLSRISSGALAIGSIPDIYFGTKQAIEEREPAGKAQGILFASAGVLGAGAGSAGLAGTFGVAGASTVAAVTGPLALGAAAVGVAMSAVPAIHGRDNKNRAIKVYNDVSHEMKQMEQADKQLSRRANVDLVPTLTELEARYGIQTRNVWLNNNAADFLNQVNSPNNTASGQWKPDADGTVWSNFSDKYIQIGGTPHQDEVLLSLPVEKNGSRAIAGSEPVITVPGDTTPEKRPVELRSLAAEPARYKDEGWSGSVAQPAVSKQYAYQTSSWGQHWETEIPLAINAGPLYLSHPVSENGRDAVVLIEDTSIERPGTPVPKGGYTEGVLFGHDGKDKERMSLSQVDSLLSAGIPATIGDGFNTEASAEKAIENAYREAVYPVKEGTSYIRSPDAFRRKIVTHAEHRTVVSLQHVAHPTRIDLRNGGDILDAPSMMRQKLVVTLPPLPAGAVDQRQLGIPDEQARPVLEKQSMTPGKGGRNAIYTNTYTMGNGGTLTVHADDRSRIERFMRTAS